MSTPEAPAGRRREVLDLLRGSAGSLSVAEVADRLDAHPNTVRFHLDALVRAGRVERVRLPPSGPGRPPLVFRARPGMDPAGPRNYRALAAVLAEGLAAGPDPAANAVAAGRAWGARLLEPRDAVVPTEAGVRTLVGLLDDLGFEPEWPSSGSAERVGLRHCPFLEVARARAEVVCSLHLGLMRGAVASLGAPVTVDRLEPFAEPDLCLVHLSTPDSTTRGGGR
ncbi:helix-turn-helix transcriptional regulator [Umezawaea sp.]|uniref:helix-turn-helix transcriptional regulator n=1 Tax=Umezawaea sp. TaxID=1955258 RepID=UPI002ECFF904